MPESKPNGKANQFAQVFDGEQREDEDNEQCLRPMINYDT